MIEMTALRKKIASQRKPGVKRKDKNEVKGNSAVDKYRMLLEQIPILTYVTQLDDFWNYIFVSPQIQDLTGYSQAEMINNPSYLMQKLIHPEDRNRVAQEANSSQATHKAFVSEYRIFHRDDSLRWFHDEAVVIRDESGNPVLWSGVVFDITKRKLAEEALRESEERFRQLAENIHEVFWLSLPEKARMLYVSPTYEEIWGCTCASLYERPASFLDAIHPNDRARVIDRQKDQIRGGYDEQYEIVRPDGSTRWVRDRAFPIKNERGEVYRIAGIAEDITERMKAEKKILAYQKQLRFLASQLSLAEERERRLLATGLHDRIGQNLAITMMKLGALKQFFPCGGLSKALEEIRLVIEETIRSVRSLIFEISPPILYELGLEAALESLTEKFQQEHGIIMEFYDDCKPKPIGNDLRVTLFQATRELLMNIAKHSRATRAKVRIRRLLGFVIVTVKDNGTGCKDNGTGFKRTDGNQGWYKAAGFGLFSIRERLIAIGGHLKIESKPGLGVRITIVAPLKTREDGNENKSSSSR